MSKTVLVLVLIQAVFDILVIALILAYANLTESLQNLQMDLMRIPEENDFGDETKSNY